MAFSVTQITVTVTHMSLLLQIKGTDDHGPMSHHKKRSSLAEVSWFEPDEIVK